MTMNNTCDLPQIAEKVLRAEAAALELLATHLPEDFVPAAEAIQIKRAIESHYLLTKFYRYS